jgi:putative peptidoglycan lipid II flippase
VLWIAMPVLAPIAAPGFSPAQLDELVALSRIILPAQVFLAVGGLLSASIQARDKHALPALAPLVYTLGIIAGG